VSHERPVQITPCRNGPLLVRGDVELVDSDGEVIPHARRTVALCRCGVSLIKPYCDGSHKMVDFRTE
jgi:CDGSH-type Zn-finger protein